MLSRTLVPARLAHIRAGRFQIGAALPASPQRVAQGVGMLARLGGSLDAAGPAVRAGLMAAPHTAQTVAPYPIGAVVS